MNNRNWARALAALLTEPTVERAAAACGLAQSTIYGYLRDPAFRAALQARQGDIIQAAVGALANLAGEAVGVLGEIVKDTEAGAAVRVRAALGILDQAARMAEFATLEERIRVLEQSLGGEK